jgi:phosphoglycolate phosphatase
MTAQLLFDLDGTLTDPELGITRCIAHALVKLGRAVPDGATLRGCIGPALADSFRALLDTSDPALVRAAIAHYRERFAPIGMFENEVYPGIPELLAALCDAGAELRVVTSKPTVYSASIVEHFGLARWLAGVHGSELDGARTDKADGIAHVLGAEGIAPAAATMIGDRSHDVVGARANGVRAVGVLWGYGSRDELVGAGADAIAATPGNLRGLLLAEDRA